MGVDRIARKNQETQSEEVAKRWYSERLGPPSSSRAHAGGFESGPYQGSDLLGSEIMPVTVCN